MSARQRLPRTISWAKPPKTKKELNVVCHRAKIAIKKPQLLACGSPSGCQQQLDSPQANHRKPPKIKVGLAAVHE